ncbi:MAG: amidohydrolase family protein, partial [Chloroflexi bacterium]|nr:amidohydrolase family protein [Chloroflexota bacterium]
LELIAAMRVDSHQHFWTLGQYPHAWITESLKAIWRDFTPQDLKPLLDRHRFDACVLVQTFSSLAETKFFLCLAHQHPWIAGVVGWVDLTDPRVGDTLDELRLDPKLAGIRHVVHDEPDVNWLRRADVQRGLGELARRTLPYDLLIRPSHLAASLELARRFPDLPLVVDHIAKPRIAAGGWDDWADGLAQLARCPNVWCKLSGMFSEADWARWQAAVFKRYIDHVLAVFGPERLMFGSDWPVCLLAGSYDQVVEATEVNTSSAHRCRASCSLGRQRRTVLPVGSEAPRRFCCAI